MKLKKRARKPVRTRKAVRDKLRELNLFAAREVVEELRAELRALERLIVRLEG